MSNIIEGDSVKNFGEFIPNPYIEKITVTETGTDLINLNIEYSLLFLVGDQFDINDVADLFYENTINVYGMLEAKTTNSPSTRQDLITDIHNGNIKEYQISYEGLESGHELVFIKIYGSEGLADAISDGELQIDSDLYDSEDRQILKIYSKTDVQIDTSDFVNEYLYLYLFCGTLGSGTITNAGTLNKSLLSLSIGDITYEKIFSPGLEITSDEQNVYVESNGSKFGFTPLLSTDRNFYSTNTVTREMVIDKTQTLVNRFKNGEAGTLTDMVNSIEFVLQTQGQTEDLIPELDKVRKSFPNKTNNNPVGNLYASLSQLLININSAFPQIDKLERLKYTTGKVVDGRTATTPELLPLPTSSGGEYFFKPLITRTATGDEVTNDGTLFFNFEEMVKRESYLFSNYIDVNRFYEVCDEYSLSGMKRALFSMMKEDSFKISATYLGEGYTALYDDVVFTKINYSFQEPSNLMIAYAFQHVDAGIPDSLVTFEYEIETKFEDSTQDLMFDLYNRLTDSYNDLLEYQTQAEELFSFNAKTDDFNNFFQNGVKPYWDDKGGGYPWQIAPTVYGIIAYLTTNRFSSLENVRIYTKNVIFNISPETGDLERLGDFVVVLRQFIDLYGFDSSDPTTTKYINQTFIDSIDLTTIDFASGTGDSEVVASTGGNEGYGSSVGSAGPGAVLGGGGGGGSGGTGGGVTGGTGGIFGTFEDPNPIPGDRAPDFLTGGDEEENNTGAVGTNPSDFSGLLSNNVGSGVT